MLRFPKRKKKISKRNNQCFFPSTFCIYIFLFLRRFNLSKQNVMSDWKNDLFGVLGVTKDETDDAVRRAYLRAALVSHVV